MGRGLTRLAATALLAPYLSISMPALAQEESLSLSEVLSRVESIRSSPLAVWGFATLDSTGLPEYEIRCYDKDGDGIADVIDQHRLFLIKVASTGAMVGIGKEPIPILTLYNRDDNRLVSTLAGDYAVGMDPRTGERTLEDYVGSISSERGT